jgi:hypothetical protein
MQQVSSEKGPAVSGPKAEESVRRDCARAQTSAGVRRGIARLAMVVGLTVGAAINAAAPARAAEFYNCGHLIRTSYDQGWVRIDHMDGAFTRSDLFVEGMMGGPGQPVYEDALVRVSDAISFGTLFGYQRSRVIIWGHPECAVTLH